MTERPHFHFSLSCIGEGNGNPLQCSCLENPRDGGAWWAAICGVTQSWTRLKRLSSSSSIYIYVPPPHAEPPSYLPPYPICLGCHRVPALGALPHASNLHWSSILHMVICMFQCYSLISSHPRLLLYSPKPVPYICVYFAALHIGLSLPSF